jgi:hypothetical protein
MGIAETASGIRRLNDFEAAGLECLSDLINPY